MENMLFYKAVFEYKVYADIRGGSSGRERQITVGLSTTAIFRDLGGCFVVLVIAVVERRTRDRKVTSSTPGRA